MTSYSPLQQEAARELLIRRNARKSLRAYAQTIDIPGRPVTDDEDCEVFLPVERPMAAHHGLLCDTMQRLADGTAPCRNAMVFMPPGSAKSTYCSVVGPTWVVGAAPGSQVILSSYALGIARKQSRRARSIVKGNRYGSIFATGLSQESGAADEWAMTNGSEYMATGILGGVTGNRATMLIIDDPVAGREEADSETIRRKTLDAYHDDLLTRLRPGGSTLIIQTRWHEDDLSGSILPADWDGESGVIPGRDGQDWLVIRVPAICDRPDDPIGRKIGEPLWPEWFGEDHWQKFKAIPRTWSALYQQMPAPDSGDFFRAEWFRYYDKAPARETLHVYGASDYAVTANGGDFTVHVVVGVDPEDNIHLLDLWRGQTDSAEWIEAFCDLVIRWKPLGWAEETGQIKSGVGPFLTRRQRERNAFVARECFPTRGDKSVRAQSIRGRMALNGLYIPSWAPWRAELERELKAFPAGKHDDQVDALGLAGQLLDKMTAGRPQNADQRGRVGRRYDSDDEESGSWKVA